MFERYVLPEGWRWARLGDVLLSVKNGIAAGQNFERRGYQVTRIETISSGVVDSRKVGWLDLPVENFKEFKLVIGDILFSHINSIEKLGNCAIYEGLPENLSHGVNLLLIRVNESVLVPHFLLYWLKSAYCKAYYIKKARRAIGQASLNQKDIREMPVPLPPLSEQSRITVKIQKLIQEVKRANNASEKQLEAVKSLPTAYLSQVFESDDMKKWERRRLGEICDSEFGIWGEEPDGSSGCHYILRSNNVKDGKMVFNEVAIRKVESKYLTSKSLQSGDIMVATSSGSKNLVGKSAFFIPPDGRAYLFSNFTMRLRAIANLADPLYLYFYLQSAPAKRTLELMQDTTTGLRNLNRNEFLKQFIPLPQSLNEQKCIANKLKERMAGVETVRFAAQKQLEAVNTLPQAIFVKAFAGEL
ncbi:MAG TPA: restriction endonuclease subunit S [Thermodesulfobacteriota bacterium]